MRFKIRTNHGKTYAVKELTGNKLLDTPQKKTLKIRDKAEELTADEIKALKKLAEKAEEILTLIPEEKEEEKEKEFDLDEFPEDELELSDDAEGEEEIVEDSENLDDVKINDSKKSFGSIERRVITDSDELDRDAEIANAWAKRYGGK